MKKIICMMSRKVRVGFAFLVLLSIASSYAASVWPMLFADIIDGISAGSLATIESLIKPLCLFAAMCCVAKVLAIGLRVGADVSAAQYESDARKSGFFASLSLPSTSTFLDRQSAELGALVDQGVGGCVELYKMLVKDAVPVFLTAVFIGIQIGRIAPVVFISIFSGYIVLSLLVSVLQIRSQNGIRDSLNLQHARLSGDIAQSLGHHEAIRSLSAETCEVDRLSGQIGGIAALERRHHCAMGRYDACKQLLEVALFVSVMVVGVLLASEGAMTTGAIVSVLLLCQQLVAPVDAIYRLLDETFTNKNKVDRLFEIIKESKASIEDEKKLFKSCPVAAGSYVPAVEASDVSVLTPRGITITSGINFSIKNGSVARLVGRTGCGKSSLMKVLFNYNLHSGTLHLFGKDVSGYSRKQLSDLVFYLPQDSFVFSGTVRENLVYGLDDGAVDDADLVCALEKARFTSDEVGNLIEFLNRLLPENGKDLSGGQRQRLQAARLFLRAPRLLLADEPTASLDIPTATALMSAMVEHLKSVGGTTVFISHQEPVQEMSTLDVLVGEKEQQEIHSGGCCCDAPKAA